MRVVADWNVCAAAAEGIRRYMKRWNPWKIGKSRAKFEINYEAMN